MNISVVIPTINSSNHIVNTVKHIENYLKNNFKNYEIIIAAQTSADNTFEVIRTLKSKTVKPLFISKIGKGVGLTEGIKQSTHDWVLMIDDDLSYPIEFLSDTKAIKNKYDIIIGSRFFKRQSIPFRRRLASFFYRKLVQFLFRLPQEDVQAGLKLINKSIFQKINYPEQSGWVWDTELLYNANNHNLKILELPITYDFVQNTLHLSSTVPSMIKDVLKLRIKTLFN